MLPEGPVLDIVNLDISLQAVFYFNISNGFKKEAPSKPEANCCSLGELKLHFPIRICIEECREYYE